MCLISFSLSIGNVVINKDLAIREFLYHMWNDGHLLHVHLGFHEGGDSGVIMFM